MTSSVNTAQEKIKEINNKYGTKNLVDMVHSFLQEESMQLNKKRIEEGRTGKFYPSSVGSCKRQATYQVLGYPEQPKEGRNILILENGTSFHDRMEGIFERMGIMIAPELKLKDEELKISGRSDAIIYNFLKDPEAEYPDDKVIKLHAPVYDDDGNEIDQKLVYEGMASDVMIVEFKSSSHKSYENYIPKTKPDKKHEMQLQLYFYLTGIRYGLVYYENKNDQDQKYFHVSYNQKIVDEIIKDIRFIIDCAEKNILPEREFQPTSFECRFCNFRDTCHPVEHDYNINDIL
ncbi:CRISPR-associated exonuclease, Cas4 family [Bacillus phage vB_BauM_KLEB27-3]|nr:CRISPR-associated exonuclease, Cas4 family [Bacillus phage vB_BauM_KLEB27-3]